VDLRSTVFRHAVRDAPPVRRDGDRRREGGTKLGPGRARKDRTGYRAWSSTRFYEPPDYDRGESARRNRGEKGGGQPSGRYPDGFARSDLRFLELEPGVGYVVNPPPGIFRETPPEQPPKGGGRHLGESVQVRLGLQDAPDRIRDRLSRKRSSAAQRFVETNPEGPDIRALVDSFPPRLFGAHIRRCPQDHSQGRSFGEGGRLRRFDRVLVGVPVGERLGETEVQNLHRSVGADLDVRRLQVAMNDAVRVRCLETESDLLEDGEYLPDAEPPPREKLLERITLHQLHDQARSAVGLFEAVERCDVRMVERGEQLRLALEALHPLVVPGERVR